MADYFSGDMGSLWVQIDGPGTQPQYLGCHDLGDIAEPSGDITKRYCPSRAGAGRWTTALTSQGIPGDVTTSITTYVGKVADYLQTLANKAARCPFPIYVHQSDCGRKDVFLSYQAGTLLQHCRITSRGKSNLALREGSEAAEQSFDLSADNPYTEYWPLRMSRLTTAEAQDLLDIALCGEDRCTGACGDREEHGDEFMATSDGTVLAEVNVSADGGATVSVVAGPAAWLITEDITTVCCYSTGADTVRHIVGNGTTGAGTAEIAYTDNAGTAWTDVAVGATAGEFFPWNGCLFAFDSYHIWGCTDTGAGAAGNIYFSADSGLTWTLQATGSDALNAIKFADEKVGLCVGDTNEVLLTTDGGSSWSTLAGPAAENAQDALACAIWDAYRFIVGYDNGHMWRTFDGGASWTQVNVPMPAAAASVNSINDIDFIDEHNGLAAVKWTDGVAAIWGAIYRTFDGGFTWEIYETDAAYTTGAIGMSAVAMATPNLGYGVGDLCAGTATIYKLSL